MPLKPKCPDCAGDTWRVNLAVRPAVYVCDHCNSFFTRRARPVPGPSLRALRRAILRRWDQLADDVHHLVQQMREAPAGVFTPEELNDAVFELDETVWDVMVNSRPRLPQSRHAPPSRETVHAMRVARLARSVNNRERNRG